jgi:hypothetical protein
VLATLYGFVMRRLPLVPLTLLRLGFIGTCPPMGMLPTLNLLIVRRLIMRTFIFLICHYLLLCVRKRLYLKIP